MPPSPSARRSVYLPTSTLPISGSASWFWAFASVQDAGGIDIGPVGARRISSGRPTSMPAVTSSSPPPCGPSARKNSEIDGQRASGSRRSAPCTTAASPGVTHGATSCRGVSCSVVRATRISVKLALSASGAWPASAW